MHTSKKGGHGTEDRTAPTGEAALAEGMCPSPATAKGAHPVLSHILFPCSKLNTSPPCSPQDPTKQNKARQNTANASTRRIPSKVLGAHKNADRNKVFQMGLPVGIWHVQPKINFSILLPSLWLRICIQWAPQCQKSSHLPTP